MSDNKNDDHDTIPVLLSHRRKRERSPSHDSPPLTSSSSSLSSSQTVIIDRHVKTLNDQMTRRRNFLIEQSINGCVIDLDEPCKGCGSPMVRVNIAAKDQLRCLRRGVHPTKCVTTRGSYDPRQPHQISVPNNIKHHVPSVASSSYHAPHHGHGHGNTHMISTSSVSSSSGNNGHHHGHGPNHMHGGNGMIMMPMMMPHHMPYGMVMMPSPLYYHPMYHGHHGNMPPRSS